MIVLVTGGRAYTNWQKVHSVLDGLHAKFGIDKIVQGCGKGTDAFASSWAALHGIEDTLDQYKPDWDEHGRRAGIKRNVEMLHGETPHLVVGFEGGRGTAHMTEYAALQGVPTLIIPDPEWVAAQLSLELDPLDDVLVEMDEDGNPIAPPGEDGNPFWLCAPTERTRLPKKVVPLPPTPEGRYDDSALF